MPDPTPLPPDSPNPTPSDKPPSPITANPTPGPAAAPPPAAVTARPAAPAAAAPKPAPKPAAKGKGDRRFFLVAIFTSWVAAAWAAMTASLALMTLGTLRFLYPNVLSEPPSKIKVGFPDNYEEGKVVDRYKEQHAWIVRRDGIIYALSTTCTHLGCTPNWLEREQKFKCPCHGSGFYITGINFEGPAPRPLERWAVGIGEDGQIVVDMSKKFQQERGEWSNPESYIKV
jgi:cytochrome b6-f complex iron-sulfur subunit